MITNLTDTQKSIIKILFVEKESSRSLLAKKLSLTNAALTLSLKPLIEDKYVLENKNDSQKVGRKELKLSLNPKHSVFFGIDIKKNNTYYSLMDFASGLITLKNSKECTISDFLKGFEKKVSSVGVTMRGNASLESFLTKHESLYQELAKLSLPIHVFNNVDCLADIYSLHHQEDKNFILVKYGPGVGSSIYVNGKSLGNQSELGHTYYHDKTVEDTISYMSILNKDVNEEEGTALLLKEEEKLKKVIHVLSFSLLNADSLLSLQKIVLSGALLSKEEIIEKLKDEIHSYKEDFHLDKLCLYPDYNTLNIKKSCIGAFIKTYE